MCLVLPILKVLEDTKSAVFKDYSILLFLHGMFFNMALLITWLLISLTNCTFYYTIGE